MNTHTFRIIKNGRPVSNIKVVGGINHFIYSGSSKAVYTDSYGYAQVEWEQDTYLDAVYVGNDGHYGKFYNGEATVIFI